MSHRSFRDAPTLTWLICKLPCAGAVPAAACVARGLKSLMVVPALVWVTHSFRPCWVSLLQCVTHSYSMAHPQPQSSGCSCPSGGHPWAAAPQRESSGRECVSSHASTNVFHVPFPQPSLQLRLFTFSSRVSFGVFLWPAQGSSRPLPTQVTPAVLCYPNPLSNRQYKYSQWGVKNVL